MLDTLIIIVVFVLSYFSLIRKSNKDRQSLLLDRLERYLDRVEAKERKKNKKEDEETKDMYEERMRKREEEDGSEDEGDSETEVEEEDGEDESPSVEDALTLLSKTFMDAAGGTSEDTEKLVQASRELLKENLGTFISQESQKEFAKIFDQLTEFVKL